MRGNHEEGEKLSERYYRSVKEVKEVFKADEANGLLKEGWELLKVTEVQRDEVAKLAAGAEAVARLTLVVYLMGKDQEGSVRRREGLQARGQEGPFHQANQGRHR
jgi:hypothetical protein